MESCDIYITAVRYENSSWTDDPDSLLELIYNNLNEIQSFYFVSLSINMSQVYNVNLKQENYDSMIMYLKGVKYKHSEFMSFEEIQELEAKIKEQLGYVEGLTIGDIEVRSSKLYTDKDLGLVEFQARPTSGVPQIIESS